MSAVPILGDRGYGRLWRVRTGAATIAERARRMRPPPVPAGPPSLVVVSPHLDDAVFSCGRLLSGRPGGLVVTVFSASGRPGEPTPWDVDCGFAAGDDVMAARQAEDDRAVAILGARPLRLGLTEPSSGGAATVDDVEHALRQVVDALPGDVPVVLPLGIQHDDHRLVAAAGKRLTSTSPPRPWWWYGDLPYSRNRPGEVADRLADLGQPVRVEGHGGERSRKAAAVRRYHSQLRALHGDLPAILGEELLWEAGA